MSGVVVVIGYILLVPSVLGILFSVFVLGMTGRIGIAGGVAIFLGFMSFLGGLLGWLLIMKKRVLQCDDCGAVVAAS